MIIAEIDPNSIDAVLMMDELSDTLESITGNSGRHSFDTSDVCVPRSFFAVAYDDNKEPVGCGAIRPISNDIAELKRMYAKTKSRGVGTQILNYLEAKTLELGYSFIWLETRLINKQAVNFYEKNGYHYISNYGKYVNNPEAVCFEKKLAGLR
jgi:Acetyltransferases